MRFVWAVVAFVLAALMIGAGIAQRTIFQGPDTERQTVEVTGDAPYVLIDGAVLRSHDGSQTLRVQQPGTIFASYGRTADLEAWLATSDYTHVRLDGTDVESTPVSATQPLADGADAPTPAGSDLWLDEFQQEDVLITTLQLPEDMSLLVATDGVESAPTSFSLTWPVRHATPWAGPLIVGGAVLLAGGIVLYLLGVRHARRSRGPRRKGLPIPVTEPIDLAVEQGDKGVISATPTRRQLSGGKRALLSAPALGLSALLFAGCSADAWPDLAPSATPTPSQSVVVPDEQQDPVVTQAQAERIVQRIAQTVATADEDADATVAATRLAGTALETRETNYDLRADLKKQKALAPIPAGPLSVTLPEANDAWPRTFLAVASTDAGDEILSVTQQDPWSEYKLTYAASLVSDAELNLAPAYVGAISIPADSPFLAIAPGELATAYADVLAKGEDSEYFDLFDTANDAFIESLDKDRTDRLALFNETGAKTGKLTFGAKAGDTAPAALATLDSGAIVAVTVDDLDKVTPTDDDAVIKLDDNPVVESLTGVSQSSKGFTTTWANQLFFFVPSQSSQERIQLLGFSSEILNAKVID